MPSDPGAHRRSMRSNPSIERTSQSPSQPLCRRSCRTLGNTRPWRCPAHSQSRLTTQYGRYFACSAACSAAVSLCCSSMKRQRSFNTPVQSPASAVPARVDGHANLEAGCSRHCQPVGGTLRWWSSPSSWAPLLSSASGGCFDRSSCARVRRNQHNPRRVGVA